MNASYQSAFLFIQDCVSFRVRLTRFHIGAIMNIYGVIILTTLIFSFLLDVVSQVMNIRAMDPRLPAEFNDVFDQERYETSQEYNKTRISFGNGCQN